MNIEEVRDYTLSLPGVTEDQPFGDDIITFRLEGKIFVCPAVTPAWHWNKKHWSDVYYEQVDDALVKAWIRESHQLIASKLPKALRSQYFHNL